VRFADEALAANQIAAQSYDGDGLSPRPLRHVAVLACMDARLDLFKSLGLAVGDCHVLRNAGGRVTGDAIRSLTLSSHVLDTREFVIIHHTDCGLERTSNRQLYDRLAEAGVDAAGYDFLPIMDREESVREDVEKLAVSELMLPGIHVTGLIFDVETGLLHKVCEAETLGPVEGRLVAQPAYHVIRHDLSADPR
jgi:carbonic anhydrase